MGSIRWIISNVLDGCWDEGELCRFGCGVFAMGWLSRKPFGAKCLLFLWVKGNKRKIKAL